MTQREEIKALRHEVAELRKQITLLLDVERIIARQPQMLPYPVYPEPYQPRPWYQQPWITYMSPNTSVVASGTAAVASWNDG